MTDMDSATPAISPSVDFIAGTIAGMSSLAVGFPFDTVKVRFQNPAIAGRYTSSTFGTLATILREERVLGLYRGIMSPMASVALMNGIVFASYRFFIKAQLNEPNDIPTLTQITLAGAASGIICSTITTPIELIKIRQQSIPFPTTARGVALQIFKEQGPRGLYCGLVATALRDLGYGAYFCAYEATCRYFTNLRAQMDQFSKPEEPLPWSVLLFAGGVAGIAGWIFTFPFDTIKTRIQSSCELPVEKTVIPMSSSPLLPKNPYSSILSTAVHSYRHEGMGVFFRGLGPTIIRAIPVNMVTFGMFEAIVNVFSS